METCNYDSWKTKVPKKVTPKLFRILKTMEDGTVRSRAAMLRNSGVTPNPRSANGFAGSEYSDYFLYKLGMLEFCGTSAGQKLFKISEKGAQFLKVD